MTHQADANSIYYPIGFCSAKSLVVRATLTIAFLFGSGGAMTANAIASDVPSTVTAAAVKKAKPRPVKKPTTVKPRSQRNTGTVTNSPSRGSSGATTTPRYPSNSGAATNGTFGQKEVDQNKFIAVAVPYGGNRHQLVILEQISPKKACWNERGTNGAAVQPLLLDFDFTGICGRSTDSNGYSIRVAGQDLNRQYDLDILRRGEQLVLVGINFRDRSAPPIEIGKTQSIGDGLLKINLEPGWRFSKRTYDGKTLGHIYLTNDSPLASN